MVGVAAIAVNRYLVRTHDDLVRTSLPALELANRIGASAEVVGPLAAALVQADNASDLDQTAIALGRAVDGIESGARRLIGMTSTIPPATGGSTARNIVARMTGTRHAILALSDRIGKEAIVVAGHGAQFDALVEAETDLARLRITAGIAGIYADRGVDPAPALDRLADRDFFAFERLSELARVVDQVRLQFQQVPQSSTPDGIDTARSALSDRLTIVARRIGYMPTAVARDEAQALLLALRHAVGPDGLIGLQRDRVALQADLAADNDRLSLIIGDLSGQARRARDAVQAEQLAQIEVAQRRSSLLAAALLAVVAVAVIAGLALWTYARGKLVTRLGNISQRIVAVARGDYVDPVPISGYDEIGRMEKALNILRRRAQDAARLRDSLEAAVIARTGDVVAEMKMSDAARAEAEAASRSKTEFLARMSHEIRTPLNGIIGMLGLLVDDETDDRRKERAHTAHRSARELLEITNDILNYASSEDQANRGNPVHFRLRELVGQMGQHLQSLAAEKGLKAVIDLTEPAPPVLFGDVVKIRQIVGNLVSNAVKYTKRGTVTFSVDHALSEKTGQPVVSFTVADTGVGMTREAVAHAFDAYARTDAAKRAGIEGLGLGLAISRNLTEALGGALNVESEPGVGSRFTLTVPLLAGDAAQVAEDEAHPARADLGRDVLVIEDHAVNRIVARGYLERLGCRVHEAETGASGLRAAKARRFDLILIDLDLPDMRGEEVAARIGAEADAPVLVALTAHLIDDTEDNRTRLGVSRILAKPISPRALTEVLTGRAPAAATSDGAAVLDTLRDDMADLGPETTARILDEFLQDLTGAVEVIRTAPPEHRRKAAHRLKGAASNFRLGELCAVLARVEKMEGGADDGLLSEVRSAAGKAATTLEHAAREVGLQTIAGSTK